MRIVRAQVAAKRFEIDKRKTSDNLLMAIYDVYRMSALSNQSYYTDIVVNYKIVVANCPITTSQTHCMSYRPL